MKHAQDNPSIGLLLCKSKNKVVAEYALGDKSQPMGIAEYNWWNPCRKSCKPACRRSNRSSGNWASLFEIPATGMAPSLRF